MYEIEVEITIVSEIVSDADKRQWDLLPSWQMASERRRKPLGLAPIPWTVRLRSKASRTATFVAGVGSGNPTVYVVRVRITVRDWYWHGHLRCSSDLDALVYSQELELSNNAVSWGVGVKDIIVDCSCSRSTPQPAGPDRQRADAGQDDGVHGERHVHAQIPIACSPCARCWRRRRWWRRACDGAAFGSDGGGGGGGEYAEGWFTAAQIGAS